MNKRKGSMGAWLREAVHGRVRYEAVQSRGNRIASAPRRKQERKKVKADKTREVRGQSMPC